MATSDDLLDLVGAGQRASEFRFDVLDQTLTKVGTIAPDSDSPARIANNTNATIKRTISQVTFNAGARVALVGGATRELDSFGDRLRPMMILENGDEYPLGVFILGGIDRKRWEWGLDADVSGVDQGLILDQPLERSVGYPAGAAVREALLEQFAAVGVPSYDVDPAITSLLANPIAWPAGNQSRRTNVVNELAALGGAYSAYFDNAGTGRVLRVPDLSQSNPSLVYDSGGRMIAGSMVESDDVLEAPNRYIVIDSGNPDFAISGYYDIPGDAPHSEAGRGFVVGTVIPEQGLASEVEAVERAKAAAAQDHGTFEWVQFSGPPDPRHDTFDPVLYLGQVYREQGWSMVLQEGGEMTHDLRRVYGAA